MPTEYEVFEVAGRELGISNPDKVYFRRVGVDEGLPRPLMPGLTFGRERETAIHPVNLYSSNDAALRTEMAEAS